MPNYNDIMHVANIVLNKVPNSSDTMHIGNNVRLTAMVAQQLLMVAIKPLCRKANLAEMRNNDPITRKVHADGNKLCPGKNGSHKISSLGGRSISMGQKVGR